jgi:DNA-binding NarL/FixJ family response regulator
VPRGSPPNSPVPFASASSGAPHRVRVVFVDDNVLAAQALQRFMHARPEVSLTAWAVSVDEALGRVAADRPDVVLLDLDMPGVDTLSLIARLEEARGTGSSPLRVVMFSGHCRSADIERSLAAGAAGYIGKDEPTSVIVDLVVKAAAGKVVLSPMAQRAFLGSS